MPIGIFVVFRSVFLRYFDRYFCGVSVGTFAVNAFSPSNRSPIIIPILSLLRSATHVSKREILMFQV